MNTFDDRKKAFEAKFIQDAELQFKLKAKRNKCLGEWAAEELQKENKEDYIKEVRESDLEKPGDEDIFDKIMNDFLDSNKSLSKEDLQEKFNECEDRAKKELISEKS